jgi:uncharacterized protein YkwD
MKKVNKLPFVLSLILIFLTTSVSAPALSVLADAPPPYTVFLPAVRRDGLADKVNPQERQASLNFYETAYLGSSGAVNWTGSQAGCVPGGTNANFKLAVLQRINYFRAMAGVPAKITFSDTSNRLAQAAALIMSANNTLNHSPTSNMKCYSTDGKTGAGSSNLAIGVYGWDAISLYMMDPGAGNNAAGHRRWILYPRTQVMGTGDVPGGSGFSPTNALRVFGDVSSPARPVTREEFVAWPPPGFVPYPVVFARWTFSYDGADFSAAAVGMSAKGTNWTVSQAAPVNGYGENTLVWIPNGMGDSAGWPNPGSDMTISVSLHNVKINGVNRDFSYDVIVFDPGP